MARVLARWIFFALVLGLVSPPPPAAARTSCWGAGQAYAPLYGYKTSWCGANSPAFQWDPAAKGADVTLSSTNHLAVNGLGGSFEGVRSVKGHSTGKWYFEAASNGFASATHAAVGLSNASGPLAAGIGTDANSLGYYAAASSGANLKQNNATCCTVPAYSQSETVAVAVDIDNHLIWFKPSGAAQWNAGGSADPATGVGGISYTVISGTLFAAASMDQSGGGFTLNTGDSAFTFTRPTGFTAWAP